MALLDDATTASLAWVPAPDGCEPETALSAGKVWVARTHALLPAAPTAHRVVLAVDEDDDAAAVLLRDSTLGAGVGPATAISLATQLRGRCAPHTSPALGPRAPSRGHSLSSCTHPGRWVAPGVRLAGVVLQAGDAPPGSSLLEWDGDGGVLSDVFARVGGPGSRAARADTMVRVAGAGVVLDNVWLWRADHAALAPGEEPRPGEVYHLVADGECYSETGLVVDGDDVVAYGLAVEHTLKDQVIWRGERGRVFFYQSELPYDVDQAFADAGHVGYRVTAAAHESVGAGIYSFFRDSQCLVPAAVAAPPTANFTNAFTKHLNGHPGILSVT